MNQRWLTAVCSAMALVKVALLLGGLLAVLPLFRALPVQALIAPWGAARATLLLADAVAFHRLPKWGMRSLMIVAATSVVGLLLSHPEAHARDMLSLFVVEFIDVVIAAVLVTLRI